MNENDKVSDLVRQNHNSRKLTSEAVEALTALGYSAAEAAGAVKKVKITEEMTAEDVLKGALRHLAFL